MCRLYGFLANANTKVECTLVRAQNSLMRQSRQDSRGHANADGWGIAYYENGSPEIERRATPAFDDQHFDEQAAMVFSTAVLAHIRMATVGQPSQVNTHPFGYGCWSFAHNGIVSAFDLVKEELVHETDSTLQSHCQGTTDSEQVFFWLLSRMSRAGVSLFNPAPDIDPAATVLAESTRHLIDRCKLMGDADPARLNFLLTDGKNLFATCWNNSLHYVVRHGVHDCEVCGIPHVQENANSDYRAVVIASEPISHESWQEIANGTICVTDRNMEISCRDL